MLNRYQTWAIERAFHTASLLPDLLISSHKPYITYWQYIFVPVQHSFSMKKRIRVATNKSQVPLHWVSMILTIVIRTMQVRITSAIVNEGPGSSTNRSRDSGGDEQRQRIRPGQKLVLFPPSLHHQADIEPQHERHWNRFALRAEILSHLLEYSASRQCVS
ncbi:unnamed protein product [Euphydryas editha]|uniref:Uncharacterized protein n=1 Tax=Euphydryas editha TaxID=104508 RepID=A0AAU9V2N5_EUPED|nr:unnamed protein product [Euphydryas editha]